MKEGESLPKVPERLTDKAGQLPIAVAKVVQYLHQPAMSG